ncbi:MAG: type II CRISPR RNA-guided endonuclease Cas9 [Terriglobales bacterium]
MDRRPLILGLDIGSASIGWALVDRAGDAVVAAGVRIFPAGVNDADFAQGRPDSSNNAERRRYRMQRRKTRRRAGRQRSLFLLLQRHGLLPGPYDATLPASQAADPQHRHAILTKLDSALLERWSADPKLARLPAPAQVLPYFLRAHALDHALAPEEVGRVLYHLGQRRGFKSNRRDSVTERQEKKQKEADDASRVKGDILLLEQEMATAGSRTLGEHLSRLDPAAAKIRRRWTGRKMHEAEYAAIWAAQVPHHTVLTPELRSRIGNLLYFQRPVGNGRPGECELEPGQKRACMAKLAAQRFRLLQKVNDLRLVGPDEAPHDLDQAERVALLDALEREGGLTFAAVKKIVHVPKGYHLNLERGGEKKLPGNQTAKAMRAVFGDRWEAMSPAQQDKAVEDWLLAIDDEAFTALGHRHFGLEGEALQAWSGLELPQGYAKLSLAALRRLLPLMEQGQSFKAAETAIYGDRFSGGVVHDRLPAVVKTSLNIPNPAVMRALSELRQLVNAITREYGKPWEVRIELARDLKRNAKQRAMMAKGMRQNESQRERLAKRITDEVGLAHPSNTDKLIAALWEQSKGTCPYCGQPINFRDAFGGQAAQIDHILPRNRFPDDSFSNKVLAHAGCNQGKGGRTPFEAFGADPDLWDQILQRVKAWEDPAKLRAFQVSKNADLDAAAEGSFAARRLNDTRYASTQAVRYLGELYGGRDAARSDGTRRQVIFATSGVTTAALRKGWCLEEILGRLNATGKNRLDHRHHAVDAVVIALTSPAAIQQLAFAAAADASGRGRISSKTLVAPWPNFVDSIRPVIERIQISHRPNHRLRGSLHADTVYSRNHLQGEREFAHVRKWVYGIKNVDDIVDSRVREAVRAKLAELGNDSRKLQDNWPTLQTRNGASVAIKKARLRARVGTAPIGRGPRERHIAESGNHHVAIFAGRYARRRERWQAVVVSRLEAAQRRARGLPVISHQWPGEGEFEFQFSLMGGDLVEMAGENGEPPEARVVRTISEDSKGRIELDFVAHSHAAQVGDLRRAGQYDRVGRTDELRERGCRKLTVDVLGRLHEAHG